MAGRSGQGGESVTFVISVAAELAGMHPQTLRQYDRLGLVTPARTKGRGRRYTKQDIQRLRDVQRMSQDEGINLEGIRRILELQRRVEALEAERARMRTQLAEAEMRRNRVFVASPPGEGRPLGGGERPGAGPGGGGGPRRPAPALLPAPLVAVRAVIEGTAVPERQ